MNVFFQQATSLPNSKCMLASPMSSAKRFGIGFLNCLVLRILTDISDETLCPAFSSLVGMPLCLLPTVHGMLAWANTLMQASLIQAKCNIWFLSG